MREVAASPVFAPHLAGVLRGSESVAEPAQYAELLAEAGCAVDLWETTYLHVLPGEDAVLQFRRILAVARRTRSEGSHEQ